MVQKLYEKFGVTAWVVITALLLTYMTMSTVATDADAYNDSSMSAVFLVLLFVALAGAVCVRYIFSSRKDGSKLPPLVWVSVWSLPLLVTLVMLPWLLEGILVDRDVRASRSALRLSTATSTVGELDMECFLPPATLGCGR